jgi:hypothetical protein
MEDRDPPYPVYDFPRREMSYFAQPIGEAMNAQSAAQLLQDQALDNGITLIRPIRSDNLYFSRPLQAFFTSK